MRKFDKDEKKAWVLKGQRVFLSMFKIVHQVKVTFMRFDQKVDHGISFFLKHYGKSKFMVSMSKKAQHLGIERLYEKGPKAFFYFFLFYLIRDTILYVIIPIFFAHLTST